MDPVTFTRAQWARVVSVVLLGLGVLAIILGYVGVSGTPFTAEQLPYIASGAVGGIFLLGMAATLYISADLQDEWKKLDDIDQHLDDLEDYWDRSDAEEPITEPTPAVGRRTASPPRSRS